MDQSLKTWENNSYSSIVEAVDTHYVQYDVKLIIENDTFQTIQNLFRDVRNYDGVTKLVGVYTLAGPVLRILNHHLAIVINADSVEQMRMRKKL